MPVTKQVIKRMKQSNVKRARNRHYSSRMKSMIKLILGYAKKNEVEKANKIMPDVTKAIDTAAKKKLIHKHNAAHKKSHVQKALNAMTKGGDKKSEKAPEKKEEPVKKD